MKLNSKRNTKINKKKISKRNKKIKKTLKKHIGSSRISGMSHDDEAKMIKESEEAASRKKRRGGKNAGKCHECLTEFSSLGWAGIGLKQHHCRGCEEYVCELCSKGKGSSRMCKSCLQPVQEIQPSLNQVASAAQPHIGPSPHPAVHQVASPWGVPLGTPSNHRGPAVPLPGNVVHKQNLDNILDALKDTSPRLPTNAALDSIHHPLKKPNDKKFREREPSQMVALTPEQIRRQQFTNHHNPRVHNLLEEVYNNVKFEKNIKKRLKNLDVQNAKRKQQSNKEWREDMEERLKQLKNPKKK